MKKYICKQQIHFFPVFNICLDALKKMYFQVEILYLHTQKNHSKNEKIYSTVEILYLHAQKIIVGMKKPICTNNMYFFEFTNIILQFIKYIHAFNVNILF